MPTSATGDPRRPGRARPADAGETLIEALVMVAILMMVSLMAFPRLQQGLLALSQRQTAASVEERLREARATALMDERPVTFQVAGNGRDYGWRGAVASASPGVRLAASQGPITFAADGTSTGGGVWVLVGRRGYLIVVDAANGAVALSTS